LEQRQHKEAICNVNILRCGTVQAHISVIAQIAIGDTDLYTRIRTRDNIMVSLKIASPFSTVVLLLENRSAPRRLLGLSLIFIACRLISAFIVANDGFRCSFHFYLADYCSNAKDF